MPLPFTPDQNYILGALPPDERRRLFLHLRPVCLQSGQVLSEAGDSSSHLYFPTGSVVSLLCVLNSGAPAEISIVGNEGAIGIELFMGGHSTTTRALVHSPGSAFRLSAAHLKRELERRGQLHQLLLRYTHSLITQTSQLAACNRHHCIDQQLSRWLLMSLDRRLSPTLAMTQEGISALLGVRREGVTEAAGKLQKSGIIRCRRGEITVIDRIALEQCSCECYRVIRTERDRLMPAVPDAAGNRDSLRLSCALH